MVSLCQIRHQYTGHSSLSARRSPPLTIRCGLRNGPRKSLWRSHVLSTEAIQAIHALKLAAKSSSPDKMDSVLRGRVDRLFKSDIIAVLVELKRQDQLDLALQVIFFLASLVICIPHSLQEF
jgi:chitinase